MDLDSTLIRAEALFRRFQRLVEAVDKKGNFPPPKIRDPPASPSKSTDETPKQGENSAGPASPRKDTGKDNNKNSGKKPEEPQVQKVITPELRELLSRKVVVLPRKTVAKKGDGPNRS